MNLTFVHSNQLSPSARSIEFKFLPSPDGYSIVSGPCETKISTTPSRRSSDPDVGSNLITMPGRIVGWNTSVLFACRPSSTIAVSTDSYGLPISALGIVRSSGPELI